MDPELKRLYARAIDTPSGKCFCVVVSGPDVDGDGFDVTVFHAQTMRTYVGKGLRAPPRWIKPDLWMPLALRALASEKAPEGVRFSFNPDTGALSWTWPAREVGMSAGAQQSVTLRRVMEPGSQSDVADAGSPLEHMMCTVWESCYRLLLSCRQLDLQLQRQTDSLSRTRRELQECTEKHKGLVEELHIKFARVLDAKKEKLIQQQSRIRELEEQLQAARQELAEAEAAHTDEEAEEEEEGEGEPEGETEQRRLRRRQQQQPPGEEGPTAAAARTLTHSPTMTAPPSARPQLNGCDTGPSSRLAAATVAPAAVTMRRLAADRIVGGGGTAAAAAGGAAAPGIPAGGSGGGLAEMDWEEGSGGGGEAPRGATAAPPVPAGTTGAAGLELAGGGGRAGTAAAAAGTSQPPAFGGTYASLGATQIEDDLLLAATQPAPRVAPLPTGTALPLQQPPEPLVRQPPSQQQPARQQQQQQQGQGQGQGQPPGQGRPTGGAGSPPPGGGDGGAGGGALYGSGDDDINEEDEEDDDAALGLGERR
ncbi:hypothetical protein PLESTB_001698000 [Pleodorina starrii]|uniref:Uncharacterized protein n=1 Tax=Pleodorina starrii TaxID=330485 RepID=A0A9W6F919_9CHLO|nr:hypothetical protein PLESTB_001698000 [Pleodorina starrii]GLC76722.1 hypothetical protein PLESTF_001823200 [Pleodorina starrii]